jgi:hypothetical protein
MDADETAVSRDERNEYHGITVERARKVLEAFGVRLVTRVKVEPMGVGDDPPYRAVRPAEGIAEPKWNTLRLRQPPSRP